MVGSGGPMNELINSLIDEDKHNVGLDPMVFSSILFYSMGVVGGIGGGGAEGRWREDNFCIIALVVI